MMHLPPLDNIGAQIALSEAYDHTYGIFNYDSAAYNPLSIVAQHPIEDTLKVGLKPFIIKRFRIYDIQKRYGLSLTELLALPRDTVTDIFDDAAKAITEEEEQMQQIQEEMREAVNEQRNAKRKAMRAQRSKKVKK
tara:strand:- start:506 stop:913 length:408 start_codon:yes stop_codon:yes gene_type:complete